MRPNYSDVPNFRFLRLNLSVRVKDERVLVEDALSLIVFTESIALTVFAEKLWGAFAMQKLLTFCRQKNGTDFAFEILTSR